jgi:uncharacterized protein YprB with RNaseH-like and TPR domain
MEQIPLPKHISDRVEKRWAPRFGKQDRLDSALIDAKLARLRTHRNYIHRYRRLLKTKLSDVERRFIERHLGEERAAMDSLSSETFPFALAYAKDPNISSPQT